MITLKIIGKHTASFYEDIFKIGQAFYPELTNHDLSRHESRQGTYLALRMHLKDNLSVEQLNALCTALTAHPDTTMVL